MLLAQFNPSNLAPRPLEKQRPPGNILYKTLVLELLYTLFIIAEIILVGGLLPHACNLT